MNKENQNNNSISEVYCKMHPNKKAKYKVIGVPQTKQKVNLMELLCSKCAIVLVSQGYKIDEIEMDETQSRQVQIEEFLETITQTFLIIDQNELQLIEKRDELIRFCDKQKQKVIEHYNQMINILNTKLGEQIENLNEMQKRAILQFDQKQQEIKNHHQDLSQMYHDIEVNLENIILQINKVPYQQIMGQYKKRLSDATQQLSQLENSFVYLGRVYKKMNEQKVLGGLLDDCELEIKLVQTQMLKSDSSNTNSTSRNVSPKTSISSTKNQTPDRQRQNSQSNKYIEILNKVNENQLKTNNYYTSILKRGSSNELRDKYLSPKFKQ